MRKQRTHTYKGQTIYPCDYEPGHCPGKWAIQTYHHATRMPFSDECNPHYHTIVSAQAAIDEQIATNDHFA